MCIRDRHGTLTINKPQALTDRYSFCVNKFYNEYLTTLAIAVAIIYCYMAFIAWQMSIRWMIIYSLESFQEAFVYIVWFVVWIISSSSLAALYLYIESKCYLWSLWRLPTSGFLANDRLEVSHAWTLQRMSVCVLVFVVLLIVAVCDGILWPRGWRLCKWIQKRDEAKNSWGENFIKGSVHSLGWRCFRTEFEQLAICLLYTSPSPRDATLSRMPSSA